MSKAVQKIEKMASWGRRGESKLKGWNEKYNFPQKREQPEATQATLPEKRKVKINNLDKSFQLSLCKNLFSEIT